MPITITEEQALAAAPDDASRKSGRDLAALNKWESTGRSASALWGCCRGSGSKPYQTQIDLRQLAFKCSCPSRKFPCKHGLGLLLIYCRDAQAISESPQPEWVYEWLLNRESNAEKKIHKQEAAVVSNSSNGSKANAARASRVSDGVADLLRWMKDMLRGGLLQLPEKKYTYWENASRRLVDAQAPGLAGIVRSLGETAFYREGWQQEFLQQLLRLYTIVQAYEHLEQLPEALQEDIRQLCGFTVSQDYLRSQPGISDTWQVLGRQVSEQDKLVTERYWLYGEHCKRSALILQFYTRQVNTPSITLSPGSAIKADLVFFPSASPLRALIREHRNTWSAMPFSGRESWQEVLEEQSEIASVMPLLQDRLYTISNLLPVQRNGQWYLSDHTGRLMQLKPGFSKIWKLLAISGGQPLPMAVTGALQQFEPLGVWQQQHYHLL